MAALQTAPRKLFRTEVPPLSAAAARRPTGVALQARPVPHQLRLGLLTFSAANALGSVRALPGDRRKFSSTSAGRAARNRARFVPRLLRDVDRSAPAHHPARHLGFGPWCSTARLPPQALFLQASSRWRRTLSSCLGVTRRNLMRGPAAPEKARTTPARSSSISDQV